jgi:hypothetical protein
MGFGETAPTIACFWAWGHFTHNIFYIKEYFILPNLNVSLQIASSVDSVII